MIYKPKMTALYLFEGGWGYTHTACAVNDAVFCTKEGGILGEGILYLHRAGYSGRLHEGFKKALMQWNDVAVDALVKRFK